MNPAWWAVVIAAVVAVTGWAGLVARLLWTGRGILDQIRGDLARLDERLDEHLTWHEKYGDAHAVRPSSRQRPRQ